MFENEQLAGAFLKDSRELLEQSVCKINHCLAQLTDDQVWWRPHPSANSIGNLLLHICGNLRQWTIAGVGNENDTRDRHQEFCRPADLSANDLVEHVEKQTEICKSFLAEMTAAQLATNFVIQDFRVSGLQAVNHTVTHFVGHTHQVIYITRLILGDAYQFAWSPDSGRDRLPI